jgi:aldehyde dehydrogenase (NAD+)
MNEIVHQQIDDAALKATFERQAAFASTLAVSNARTRKKKLIKLHKAVLKNRSAIQEALSKDLHKNPSETDLNELYPLLSEIRYAKRRIRIWMREKPVNTPLIFKTGRSYIHFEPKGKSLIISPWNFPFLLALMPLVSAIAAGCTAIIKPAEHTPNVAKLLKKIISEIFDEQEVAVILGGAETAIELLKQPFNHIHFTGSPEVGKQVMAAAAKNLASVTLELGGKSPNIVDKSANIDIAAKRIAWSKFMNAGQICIAPDYVFVHASRHEEFLKKLKVYIEQYFGDNASSSPYYGRIIDTKHYDRMEITMREALQNGGELKVGGDHRSRDNYIGPTVIDHPSKDSRIMREEIFGPLLPVLTFNEISEVIDHVNQGDKPLIAYIYSRSRKNIRRFISETSSGGVCVNHNLINFMNPELPFGGSNVSGIGNSKGYHGFLDFSNQKAVFRQQIRFSLTDILLPPYEGFKKVLINLALKWF